MNEHFKHIKSALVNVAQLLIAFWVLAVVGLTVWFAMAAGVFEFSEGNSQTGGEHTTFFLTVSQSGETVFTQAERVSGDIREELVGVVYPTPDAAIHAATEQLEAESMPPEWLSRGLGFVGTKPAEAHAVQVCTRIDGVISNNTGGSWHKTNHRYDRNGFRFTRTFHMLNSYPAPTVQAVYDAKVSLGFCR